MSLIKQLTELIGFHSSYIDHFGQQVLPNEVAQKALLTEMGYKLDDYSLKNTIKALQEKKWKKVLEPTYILSPKNQHNDILISLPENKADTLYIQLNMEDKTTQSFNVKTSALLIEECQVLSDGSYTLYRLPIPKLEEGYHTLSLHFNECTYSSQIISVPDQCYTPKDTQLDKMWGYAVQLYSLKSDSNWGVGDFSDLATLIESAEKTGASVVGINPIHALYYNNPAHISPYSPSSRSYLNTIYIDVTNIFNFSTCTPARNKIESESFAEQLKQVKTHKLIDYPHTAKLKHDVLTLLFEDFYKYKETKYKTLFNEFESFMAEQGENLHLYATYEALYAYFTQNFPNTYSWKQWSIEYQSPESPSVKKYQTENIKQIHFYSYLQWIAHKQLKKVDQTAQEKGMPIGLYLDLAVGCDGGGFDVWSQQDLYVKGASIGAPPDAMNNLGQDWGLTPINPIKLREQGYSALINALKSSMQYSGALRIDHILGLMRQYWVAPGMKANEGIYISFPFDEILSIIALESKRNKCIVIGEDLGTVPEGFSEHMQTYGLLSYKILFFERWWETGLFKRPEIYSDKAMVTASTHDLPTIKGWWMGRDLEWRQKLELYPTEELGIQDRANRITDRERLLAALLDFNVIDQAQLPALSPPEINRALTIAVHRYLANTPSPIHLIPLEDGLEMTEQVNIPGTIDEHPNWRQKLPIDTNKLFSYSALTDIADNMRNIRPR